MEIATTILSMSQMPQGLAGITPDEDAVGIQGKAAQSPSFAMLFDKRAGMAGSERLPADSANKEITQSPFQGKALSAPVTGGAPRNDPAKGPLPGATDFLTTGLFAFALTAPDKTSQMPAQQAVTESGTAAPEKEGNSLAVSTPGESSAPASPTMQMLSGLWPEIAKGGDTGIGTKDFIGKLPSEGAHKVPMPSANPTGLVTPRELQGGISAGPPAAEKAREANEEKEGSDSLGASLIAVGNFPGEAVCAASLPEPAGPVQQRGITLPAYNADYSVLQAAGPIQAAVVGITGESLRDPAASIPENAPAPLPASEIPNQATNAKGAEPCNDNLPRMDAVIPEANGKIQASREMLSLRKDVMNNDAAQLSPPETDGSSRPAAPETHVQGRTNSGTAGNAYRPAAADAALFGKNDAAGMTGNIIQGKSPATPDSASANTGMDLSRMEIVFAAGGGENQKEPGGAVARKSSEGKTADNLSAMAFVSNPAELRSHGDNGTATPSPDAKSSLGEHITSQLREKLDARGPGSDNGNITLKLHPEELGELKINMRMEGQHLKVEITTQNPLVKEALMQNLDTLKETFSRQNIAMDRFDVSADLRQGLHQGGRDDRQMTPENRIINTGFRNSAAVEEEVTTKLQYRWENENSLVNLVL